MKFMLKELRFTTIDANPLTNLLAATVQIGPLFPIPRHAEKVSFGGDSINSDEPPHLCGVVLERDAVLILQPRFLRKWCGNKHCYSSQSDYYCPRRC